MAVRLILMRPGRRPSHRVISAPDITGQLHDILYPSAGQDAPEETPANPNDIVLQSGKEFQVRVTELGKGRQTKFPNVLHWNHINPLLKMKSEAYTTWI